MAKSKSKIPVRRPLSEERRTRSMAKSHQSELRRISSDLSKHRTSDENSVSSTDVNKTNLRVRRFTVTIKDSEGEFVKQRRSYRLTYDQDNDGGDEYKIEKETVNDPLEEVDNREQVLNDLSTDFPVKTAFNDPDPVNRQVIHTPTPTDIRTDAKSPEVPAIPSNFFQLTELESSKTVITDDTSIPIFDDEGSASNLNGRVNDESSLENSRTLLTISPVSGTTIRLLTPQDRNEPNILFKDITKRRIAKVRKAGTIAPVPITRTKTPEQLLTIRTPVVPKTEVSTAHIAPSRPPVLVPPERGDTIVKPEANIKSPFVSKEGTSNSLPPVNFKANLFKRVRKVSTPRRLPKFSPVLDIASNKSKGNSFVIGGREETVSDISDRFQTRPYVTTGITGNTFVKDSQPKKTETVTNSVVKKPVKLPKREFAEASSSMVKAEEDRYESVDLENALFVLKPKRHRRSIGSWNNEEVVDTEIGPRLGDRTAQTQSSSISGLKSNGAILNKPILKKPSGEKTQEQNNKIAQKPQKLSIEDTVNDIFTEQDRKYQLKHARYITEDLKTVKTKLKDSDFVAQHIDSKLRQIIQKRTAALSHVNNSSVKPQPDNPRSLPAKPSNQSRPQAGKTIIIPKRQPKNPSDQKGQAFEKALAVNSSITKYNTVQNVKNDIKRKQNSWLQPKIHRYNPNKVPKPKQKYLTNAENEVPNRNNRVATWILNASNDSTKKDGTATSSTGSKVTQNKKKRLNLRRRAMETIRMQRKQSTNTLSTTETMPNLINSGMYMPIGMKKMTRRPKRLKRRLYTQVGKVKGYEETTPVNENSEIPVLYSDDEDVYPEPRPLTDTADRHYPSYRRYEGESDKVRINYRDPAHKKIGRSTGALVRLFRNGDKDHKGVPLTINSRNFKNLDTLLVHLSDKIPTPTGVKYIFKWPEGTEIKSITEFRNRCVYVVSSTKNLRRDVNYGESREGFWSNKRPSAGKVRKNETELFKGPISPKESPVRNAPYVVTIINNISRKKEKVILNPQTKQTFEQWLEDIANHDMPLKALYSEKAPYLEVKSFSHLFRELRTHSNFIACGDELKPVELLKKRQAPSSNSSTDSINDNRNRKKKLPKQQEMGQIYENGRPESPSSTAMSRYDMGPRYPPLRGRPRDSRQTYKDLGREKVVEIEIDGVLREFYPPSETDVRDDGARPDLMLKCEWVYGYRGKDAQNLLVLEKTGELVYYVAAIVVLYNKEQDVQRHYSKHNEEITCMTLHPNGNLIATGQMHGKEPEHATHIRIWDGESLSTYFVIGLGVFSGGVLSIDFSHEFFEGKRSGRLMCVLDGSEKHVLSVWDWQKERMIARTTTSTDAVHSARFYPEDKNSSIIISYGARHIYFWKIFYDVARKYTAKILRDRNSGIFEDEVPKSINCVVFLKSGDIVTGDTNGNLMVWDCDRTDAFTCKHVIPAHNGTVMSLCLMNDGTLLSASGNEIKAWDSNCDYIFGKARQIPKEAGNIRSLIPQNSGGIDGRFYIGTTNSAILEGSLQDRIKYILEGHSDCMWGVVAINKQPYFVSAGFDQVVYKWSQGNHKVIWRTQIEAPCTSLAVNHKYETIAVGTADGTLVVLNSYNGMHIATVQVAEEPIGCLAFSRDLSFLAMGCNDGSIYVLKMPDKNSFNVIDQPLKGHKAGVANLDWSRDGRWIQSSSFDNELLFWDFYNMQQIKIPKGMRDVEWYTNTCHMAYSLIGPWSNMEKGEVLKAVSRSHSPNRDLCITGDTKGRLRLYKNPCTKERTDFRSARIYSSDVTAVAFTSDNTGVLTCGGLDAALVQWALVEEPMYQYN